MTTAQAIAQDQQVAQLPLMTAEEFYLWANFPENRGRIFELEEGKVIEMSRPGKNHGFICANVTRILGNYTVERERGVICSNDTGVVVKTDPDTVRGPDVLYYDEDANAPEMERGYGTTPPVLAIEVLSPNDTYGKVQRRVREQLAFGTKQVWVLDPDADNIIIHSNAGDRVLEADADIFDEELLPGFRCRVRAFFAAYGKPAAQSSR